MILGVDPGVGKTGFAVVDNGKMVHHKTVVGKKAIGYVLALQSVYKFDRAIIERPQQGVLYGRHFTGPNAIKSTAGMIKLAQNIGANMYLSDEIARALQKVGVMVYVVRPAKKVTKWSFEYWQIVFKWKGRRPSEHARDASVIALQYEKSHIWEIMKQTTGEKKQ